LSTPDEVTQPTWTGFDPGKQPVQTYYQKNAVSILVFDTATLNDIRRAQNFLQAIATAKELEEHAARWSERQT
jgi:hypothetical protein